jgi:glycosyltransferase involved in cell wall biosynthesis
VNLSIIIPAYNAEGFIEATIQSSLNIEPSAREVIVVDDGSTDQTSAICSYFRDKIRYHWVDNGGVSRARNIGAAMASGEWLLFLDADDLLLPEGPANLIKAAENSAAGMAYGMVNERQESPKQSRITGLGYAEGKPPFPAIQNYGRCSIITPGSAIIRKELHVRIGGFVSGYEPMEDRDYWIKAGMLASCAFANAVVLDKIWRPISAGKMHERRIWNGWRSRVALSAWCRERNLEWPNVLPRDNQTLLERAVNEAVYYRCWGLVGRLLEECRRAKVRTFWTIRAALEFRLRGGMHRNPAPKWI